MPFGERLLNSIRCTALLARDRFTSEQEYTGAFAFVGKTQLRSATDDDVIENARAHQTQNLHEPRVANQKKEKYL